MKILCPGCGSDQSMEDHITIDNTDYPCWYCTDCQYIWRREEEDTCSVKSAKPAAN